jgi:hypothetical protein
MPTVEPGITTADLQFVKPDMAGYLRMERGTTARPVASEWPLVGMVILWRGIAADVPTGWRIIQEFGGNFLKGALTDDEVMTTGGTAEHLHTLSAHTHPIVHNHTTASHSHTIGDHSHTFADSGTTDTETNQNTVPETPNETSVADAGHDHNFSVSGTTSSDGEETTSGATPSTNGQTTSSSDVPSTDATSETDIDPPHLLLYLIEYTGE